MTAPVLRLHPSTGPAPATPPNPGVIMPPPSDPLAVARILLQEQSTDTGNLLLRHWRGEWWQYEGPHWVESETAAIRQWLYLRLEHAVYEAPDPKGGQPVTKQWSPDKGKIDRLMDALTAPTLIERALDAPSWLSSGDSAAGYVPCTNGLVDVVTQTLQPMTPDYFGTVAIPFDYDPDVESPTEWLKFLESLWPADENGATEEIDALQEWFGYVLSGRLDLQKILLVVGPPRSGKGTIARILTDLVGKPNVGAPTLAGMATNFGLQPLLGKSLAIVGDARLQPNGQEAVVERLLSISGQDSITVDRKNREAWTGTIPARIMILSNELPKFGDASGAIASRMVILRLQESFLGREDIELEDRLVGELPAILKWALDGMRRLNQRRRITVPASSAEAAQLLADLVSPISAFIREVCDVDPKASVPVQDLYTEYTEWCVENGRGKSSVQKLSSDIRTILPTVTDYRPKIDGKAQPRHYRGVRLSADWVSRVRAKSSGWKTVDDWRHD